MANNATDERFYKGNTLLKAFGISSMMMLIFTIWMVLDDFGREWKGYQREFMGLKQKKFQEQIEAAKGAVDEKKITETQSAIGLSEKSLQAKSGEAEKLEKQLTDANTRLTIATVDYQGEKAVWDVEKYHHEADYGHEIASGHAKLSDPKAKASYEKLMKHWNAVLVLKNTMGIKQQEADAKAGEIAVFYAEKTKAEKELKSTRAELDRLQTAKEGALLTLTALMRSAPILDMANPTFRLQQIVLPTIRDDIFFSQVQKVDRCTTCHLAIDLPGFEKEEHPFKTHPNLDVILGSRSPHPIDKIGCTVCHEGRGQATHFVRTAHTPRNEEQKKEWEKKYHWHEMHHVIEKMIPLQYTEGKCRVCHKGTEYVPKAEKLNKSVQLIKSAGCYGCHRIEGWDHVRKPAPSLKRIKGKLTRDWIVKWVRKPSSFNEHARMPAAFHQSNITSEEYHQYQEAEIHAISDYILAQSESYTPNHRLSRGSVDRGKEIFGSVGCLACHQNEDFESGRGKFGQAPDLRTVGSKVTQDWMTSWLKNPRHYWSETTMPSFRLSDSEISDLSAYLLEKKNPEFDKAETGNADLEMQKKVLKLYLMRDPKMAPATDAKVDKYISELSSHDVALKLGAAGVSRYGCYGCHEIKNFEKTQGIGTELSDWGSKPVNKLDFGLLHLGHTNYDWADKKLDDTRAFDGGVVKEYLDLLRMPNFGFKPEERKGVILALLGMTALKVTPPAAKALSARETLVEEGSRLIHKYNCQGCHIVENMHQQLPEDHPDRDEHEKHRLDVEGRILSYYSEDESMGPPPLVTQGSRVRPTWVHNFLQDPTAGLRTKLKVRMPSFQLSNDEVNKIVTAWAAQGDVEFPVSPLKRVDLSGKQIADAKVLFQKLQCANCHTVGRDATAAELVEEGSSRGLAPNLSRAHGRLRREWIIDLLKDPAKMSPGTRMPGFWPEMASPAPEMMGGDSKGQIELLADYVLYLGQGFATPANESKKISEVKMDKKTLVAQKNKR